MFLDVLLMARMNRQKCRTLVCQFSSGVTSRCSALSKYTCDFSVKVKNPKSQPRRSCETEGCGCCSTFLPDYSLHKQKVIKLRVTQEVPDEDILKESGGFETMLKNLLQSPDESVLPTEQKGQTASLWKSHVQ